MTETPKTLRELLLSISTGGLAKLTDAFGRPVRARRGNGIVYGPFVSGLSERGTVEVQQRPAEHPGLWEELQTTIARLTKASSSASGTPAKAAEMPVPYHDKASAVAAQLGNAVSTWARLIAEENPGLELTATTIPDAARWIAHWTSVFPSLLEEHGAAMHADLRRVVSAAQRVIDRAPDKVYAGPCYEELEPDVDDAEDDTEPLRCQGQLYATRGKPFVWCWECGAQHDVEVRQEWLSRTLDDQLVSAAEAAPVLSWLLGKTVSRNNIAAWKRDGRVAVHDGRWPYRFGDLLLLARDMKTRKKEGSAA